MSIPQSSSTDAQVMAGIYARFSNADGSESVSTQVKRGLAHGDPRDYLIKPEHIFTDDGVSAFDEDAVRDEFLRMIDVVERGELDVVIFRHIDRLARQLPDWSRFERACVDQCVILESYEGGRYDLSNPQDAYYSGMEILGARREVQIRSQRVREGKAREARKGKRGGGSALLYGYNRVYVNPDEPRAKKRHIVREQRNEIEAARLLDMVERVLDHGEPVGSIVRDFNDRGIPAKYGGLWHTSVMRRILTAPYLAGLVRWEGEKFPIPGWDPIIDVDTHERLCRLLTPENRERIRRQDRLLTGFLPCSRCSWTLIHQPASKEKHGHARSYVCSKSGRPGACGKMRIKAEPLEEFIKGMVLDALESGKVQGALKSARSDADAGRRQEILAEITSAQERRAVTRRDYARGRIDRSDWLSIRGDIEADIRDLRREYDRLCGSETVMGDIPPAASVREASRDWSVARWRAAIRSVLVAVTVKPMPEGLSAIKAGKTRDPELRRARMLEIVLARIEIDPRVPLAA